MSYRAVTVAESTAAAIDDDLHRGRAAGAVGAAATATTSADKQAAGGALTSPSVASSTKTTTTTATTTTTTTTTAPPSNWLLRLFQSEFFNTWIAVSYLHKYPDAVGVQHYLCRELRRFPVDELLFLLPQLCHLAIHSPSPSAALEDLLMDCCYKSTHATILLSWNLEAYLVDLQTSAPPSSPMNAPSGRSSIPTSPAEARAARLPQADAQETCQRMHDRCLKILMQWHPETASGSTALQSLSAALSPCTTLGRTLAEGAPQKVYEWTGAAIVGIGCTLGAVASPELARDGQRMAVVQGRRKPPPSWYLTMSELRRSGWRWNAASSAASVAANTATEFAPSSPASPNTRAFFSAGVSTPIMTSESPQAHSQHRRSISWFHKRPPAPAIRRSVAPPSMEDLHTGKAFSFDRYLARAQSLRVDTITTAAASSVPAISTQQPARRTSAGELLSPLKANINRFLEVFSSTSPGGSSGHGHQRSTSSIADQHYFFSELQFVGALIEISRRLVPVPRPARMNSLKAELALLNHNLPARVCIPLWCEASGDRPYHHQVVRIAPDEAVVLNSADRVPFLILVEVIEADEAHPDGFVPELLAATGTQNGDHVAAGLAVMDVNDGHFDSATASITAVTRPSPLKQELARLDTTPHDAPLIDLQKDEQSPLLLNLTTTADITNGHAGAPSSNFQEVAMSPALVQSPVMRAHRAVPTVGSPTGDDFQDRMRTAAVMLAQLNDPQSKIHPAMQTTIRDRILKEMVALEETRMAKIKEIRGKQATMTTSASASALSLSSADGTDDEDELDRMNNWNVIEEANILRDIHQLKDDPSAAVFREDWAAKQQRIRAASPYGHHPNWRLLSVIVKSGADLRQEQLACQLIREMQQIWKAEDVDVWVYYYRVLITSADSGLIETITDSISVHSLKKDAYARKLNTAGKIYDLADYYKREYGPIGSERYAAAQKCFLRSLAGYCLVTFILAIKDRHNGNILIDKSGHIIHIDFGFMLSNSPGSVGFESAPFKLSQDYLEILGGAGSPAYAEFRQLFLRGYMALRKHADKILLMVEMMQQDSKFPCFSNNPTATIAALRDRFQLTLTERQLEASVDTMLASSANNMFSRLYDAFQYYSQGVL